MIIKQLKPEEYSEVRKRAMAEARGEIYVEPVPVATQHKEPKNGLYRWFD